MHACGRQPQRQPALLRTTATLVDPICAKRFHRRYYVAGETDTIEGLVHYCKANVHVIKSAFFRLLPRDAHFIMASFFNLRSLHVQLLMKARARVPHGSPQGCGGERRRGARG